MLMLATKKRVRERERQAWNGKWAGSGKLRREGEILGERRKSPSGVVGAIHASIIQSLAAAAATPRCHAAAVARKSAVDSLHGLIKQNSMNSEARSRSTPLSASGYELNRALDNYGAVGGVGSF